MERMTPGAKRQQTYCNAFLHTINLRLVASILSSSLILTLFLLSQHGRIAMMAMAGVIVHNNKWTFDGYLSPSQNLKFTDINEGIGGLFQVPKAGLARLWNLPGGRRASLMETTGSA